MENLHNKADEAIRAMLDFIIRASEPNARPEEIAALPGVAAIVINAISARPS